MIEFLKTKLIWLLAIVLALSVAGNVYFITGKGIQISKDTIITSTTTGYTNSGASSIGININGGNYYGYNKKTEYQYKIFDNPDALMTFMNTKNEGELYNSKIVFAGTKFMFVYRNMDVEFKSEGTTTVKTINGKEVK